MSAARPLVPVEGEHPLRAWRLRKGISRAALARRLGVQPNTVWRVETGLNRPSYDLTKRIWRVTGTVDPDSLVAWDRAHRDAGMSAHG
jgi:DNA-binding XRE family transcriptional regulator